MRLSCLSSCLLLAVLFQMISCAGSPGPVPIEQPMRLDAGDPRCQLPFPDGEWQLVHSIQATMPGGHKATLIGITALHPETGAVGCVLMTVEGMVLFDARYDGEIHIRRGVPPFDAIDFARGLMSDIRLLFFPPDGPLIASGTSQDGVFICRYRTEGGTVDIVVHKDNGWEIRQYDQGAGLVRLLRADPDSRKTALRQAPIPARLKLTAFGPSEYVLTLDLIEARELGE